MRVDTVELEKWFKERPQWLQDVARRLFQAGVVTAADLEESLVLCKREAGITVDGFETLKPQPIPAASFNVTDPAITLRLEAVSEIKGVNALAPRKALEFGDEPIVVIYGANGSGKSGYIRVLKHACGGRGLGILHGDVFAAVQQAKGCKINYSLGAAKKDIEWKPAVGAHADLRAVALYDTDCAHVYVNNESEVTYEPPLLLYFRVLVEVCEKVDAKLAAEITAKATSKPALPAEYAMTVSGIWFGRINWQTSEADITAKCDWNDILEADLVSLNQRLAETNPVEKAKVLRKTKGHLTDFSAALKAIETGLNDEAFATLSATRATAKAKRQAAQVDAKKAFENPLLGGITSESWRLLWEQARLYSESEAYKEKTFPNVDTDALCVLCQQPLEEPARQRFSRFEAFVKSGLETEAATAEKLVTDIIDAKKEVPTGDDLDAKLDLAGVSDEPTRQKVRSYCEVLSNRRASFLSASSTAELTAIPSSDVIEALANVEEKFETDAKAFDEDAKGGKKAELQKQARELSAQKWLSQQKVGICTEVERLKAIHVLDEARRLANTTALSSKKSTLADVLVTAAFKKRFETELKALGASRVRVAITKTKTAKGQAWHQIKLKDNKHAAKTREILSEGEFRIVSLAAFLADVVANESRTPFIFDDPISSLDQDFEELTAARLVGLSKSRQVIVFTHRLSLLAMLEDAAEKAAVKCRVVSVQRESWGTGEPNEPPLPAQKPKAALNTLIGQRLPKAKKVWTDEGNAPYQVEAKALGSDVRITIERLIENDLLADVVQRFRRPINTMGKIEKLARIKPADCAFLDAMMTKYSRYEHAQPGEAPVPLPEPDELAEDLKNLKAWLDEFTTRVIPPP
jgi:energy-coupling factor transporter ATP-binding protein EcfA2